MTLLTEPGSPALPTPRGPDSGKPASLADWVFLVWLVGFVLVQILVIPSDAEVAGAITHDSGYIGIVARNLLYGRGFVNDAHWLLFLSPDSLPMPYHNANPGYPVATFLVMLLSGWEAARSMLVVSIVGNALVGVGAWGIARHVSRNPWAATSAAIAAMLLPVSFHASLAGLPDALSTGLVLCMFATMLHARRDRGFIGAGVLLGLAWLVRSSVIIVLPAVAVWSLWRFGWGLSVRRGLLTAGAAALVMLPWLVHTDQVRGSPLKSDTGYYLLLSYNAERMHRTEEQFYRSLEPPPTTGEAVRTDPAGVARAFASGLPDMLYMSIAQLSGWSKTTAALLLLALGTGLWFLRSARAWRPELVAAGVIWLGLIGSLAVRGHTVEVRYLGVGSALLGMLLVVPVMCAPRGRRLLASVPLVLYGIVGAVPENTLTFRMLRTPSPNLLAFREATRRAVAESPGVRRFITPLPYLFTYYSERGAISPPYPGKPELLRVMDRFDAQVMLLPSDSVGTYYYPGGSRALAPDLTLADTVGRYSLYRRRKGDS